MILGEEVIKYFRYEIEFEIIGICLKRKGLFWGELEKR